MNAADVMTRTATTIPAETTIEQAAAMMRDHDVGMLPVYAMSGTLAGILTDRDIAVRAVAERLAPDTSVEQLMTEACHTCNEDDPMDAVADKMARERIRRMPVLDERGRLVGIVSLADIRGATSDEKLGETFDHVTQPDVRAA